MKLFPYFFESTATTIIQTKAQLPHLALTFGQAVKHILNLLFEKLMAGSFSRRQSSVIFEEVAQVAIFFFADRSFETHRLLAYLDDLTYLLSTNFHLSCDLFGSW